MYDPDLLPEYGQIVLEHGVEIIEAGPELLREVGEGLQQTAHAILYPVDTAKEIYDYVKGPEMSAPNIDIEEHEDVTMRSSSVAHEDPPPAP